jgi:hypothetical protein
MREGSLQRRRERWKECEREREGGVVRVEEVERV